GGGGGGVLSPPAGGEKGVGGGGGKGGWRGVPRQRGSLRGGSPARPLARVLDLLLRHSPRGRGGMIPAPRLLRVDISRLGQRRAVVRAIETHDELRNGRRARVGERDHRDEQPGSQRDPE